MTRAIDRFRDREERIDAMRQQTIVGGHALVAAALVDAGKLVDFEAGVELIVQEGQDREAYFLLAGEVEIRVNGMLLNDRRKAGQVVGEFAAINNAMPRTATVIAATEVVAIQVDHSALREAGKLEPDVWRFLAIDLTRKVHQRNQYVSRANERPRIFMVATADQYDEAEEIEMALGPSYETELWKESDLAPPGTYAVERLNAAAMLADIAIVLAHPDDLRRTVQADGGPSRESVLFELGYLMSILGRHRTLLLIPEGTRSELPEEFKGMKPWAYPILDGSLPANIALAPIVARLKKYIDEKKTRSRLEREI
ncbi:TIR domain-containing protein [Sphingopyxis sp.]|uniref:TIR domain-containing protein n=1 Tax=Sphingopyxis sp. TaxID=1908224 RepID=UPI002D789EBD|nr:TIR domain-containing protein [Sphingopyxis sp.]HET6523175.1 TIR domain-containing protein [Sphingopyxis sp.]